MATFVQPVWYTQQAEAAALMQLQQQAAQAASAPEIDLGPEHPEGLSEQDLERLSAESDAAMLRRHAEIDGFFAAVFGAPIDVATLGKCDPATA